MPTVNFSTTRGLAGESVRISTATTTLVKTGQGALLGFIVANSVAGTVIIHDALAATNALTGTITTVTSTWFAMPIMFSIGLTIVSAGTIDVTVVFL